MDRASKSEKSENNQPTSGTKKQSSSSAPHAKRSNRRRGRGQSRAKHGKQSNKRSASSKPRDTSALAVTRRAFMACPRCSFLFSGLRASLGLDRLRAMSEIQTDGWLRTEWSVAIRDLLEGHYGLVFHGDTSYFQGACPECGRMFTVSSEQDSAELSHVILQVDRQAAHPL